MHICIYNYIYISLYLIIYIYTVYMMIYDDICMYASMHVCIVLYCVVLYDMLSSGLAHSLWKLPEM